VFAEFSHTYATLPERFHARVAPTPVAAPALIAFNHSLAADLGVSTDGLDEAQLAAVCAGNDIPAGAQPLAMAYAGHQFGNFVPQLGDGRALLMGEVIDRYGQRRDLQWKGAGPTPFSRRGDGRAALGPVLREYLVSEAMHALGIPTTRALAAVTTGERVVREELLPGGVFVRVAASHIRVGTFEFFAARGDDAAVRLLADYAIARHYPDLLERPDRYFALLQAVAERQCALIARWMHVGFIHGVMNTDNMTVSGETIDFGPCAFMDNYDPATVYSYIDQRGRYAYANQAPILQWNLARFAETLLPLIDPDAGQAVDRATSVVESVAPRFGRLWLEGHRRKLGLLDAEDGDLDLVQDLLAVMHAEGADFTNTYRGLAAALEVHAFEATPAYSAWLPRWRARLARAPGTPESQAAAMRATNPAYIPRNHRVEAVITAAVERADFEPFHALHSVLSHPFDEQLEASAYRAPPSAHERVQNTFCGT
jgi:serine/tyrosine/threonine adenylyltransferase